MICPACNKEISADGYFCQWCAAYLPAQQIGQKASVFRRFVAFALDPIIAVVLYFLGISLIGGMLGPDLGAAAAVLLPIAYFIWYLTLMRKGLSPGKQLLGLQVVNQQSGAIPGLATMFVREIVGRFLSGLVFGVGYLWALFDKNAQAWHDKLAGTVVVAVSKSPVET
ncbi:MAG: RDD family protein [Gemmatimonadales bacterium]|nr:RDD family protein [Gemmatimonadales bacterium]